MTLKEFGACLRIVAVGAGLLLYGCAKGGEPFHDLVDSGSATGGTGAVPGSGGSGVATGSGGSTATGSGGKLGTGGATTAGSGGSTTTGSGGSTVTGSGGRLGTGGSTTTTGTGGKTVGPARLVLPWMDNFESNTVGGGATGWIKNPDDTVGVWAVAMDGTTKVIQETAANTDSKCWLVGGDIAWTDYKVEARVKFPTVASENLALIAVRFVDFENYYFVHLKGDGTMKIRKRIGGSTTDLVSYKSGAALTAGTWYTIAFGFQGATVTAYLNGTNVGTMLDPSLSLTAGGIALGFQNGAGSFDDVKVTAP
jgi:hypothetical protein